MSPIIILKDSECKAGLQANLEMAIFSPDDKFSLASDLGNCLLNNLLKKIEVGLPV